MTDDGFTLAADVAAGGGCPDCSHANEEVPVMRSRLSGWKHLLYATAALSTLALVAEVRYKPT